jgi:ParB family chromosome partitioning protein
VQRAVVTVGGQPAGPVETDVREDDVIRPLPDRLLTELTAHRTLALRDAVAGNPHVAMTALLHKLVTDAFRHRSATGCLEAMVRQVHFPVQPDAMQDSVSAASIADRHAGWNADLPQDDDALWDRLDVLADRNAVGAQA